MKKSLYINFACRVVMMLLLSLTIYTNANCQAIKVGDKLEGLSNGTWYAGEIKEVNAGKYKIHWNGYSDSWDEWLTTDKLRVPGQRANANQQNDTQQTGSNNTGKFKTGDRVEADKAGINSYEKGTVMPYLQSDPRNGDYYRVRLDVQARGGMYLEGLWIRASQMRMSNASPYQPEKTAVAVGKATVDANNTLSADRPILSCPVAQSAVSTSAKPNLELFKKLLRCSKGEKAASTGLDGAVTVDVTAMQLGTPRKWQYLRDIGGGPGVTIYPVKATFTYKTFYRTSTQVSENWIRIINFYVNNFGEWASGSEESIKMGDTKISRIKALFGFFARKIF
ncbi:MAG: hypothetical protein WKF88_05330 [Ferruginibacter sp.]